MAAHEYPLLLFPAVAPIARDGLPPGFPNMHRPDISRQRARIAPKFQALQQTFDAKRLNLQQVAPGQDPELVVVFETIGSVDTFVKAAGHVAGLEWLLESAEEGITPDEDFYDNSNRDKSISGRLFLIGSNQQALTQVLSLWDRYQANPSVQLPRGFAPWKQVFAQLKDVRFWSIRDRMGVDVLEYWREQVAAGIDPIRFEIEIWYFPNTVKNDSARDEVAALIASMYGRVLSRALISEIGYHGMLVEMPAASVSQLLEDQLPELVMSERIMFFRPKGQAAAPSSDQEGAPTADGEFHHAPTAGTPIVALLDGLPLQNHPLLRGRLTIDDPDEWEANYAVQDRIHGTAMASLITYGDLNSGEAPLLRPIYVRPVLRPDPNSLVSPRPEVTPDNTLLIDLMHRVIKRICEGEAGQPAAAPSVKVISLSLGDAARPFDRYLSPWARLLDWLAFKYRVLFIISAGNQVTDYTFQIPRESLANVAINERNLMALTAMCEHEVDRTILSPGESINGLTIGAHHTDSAQFPTVPRCYDLFPSGGLSPYSRIGTGFRRSLKPDLLFPGGRILFKEEIISPTESTRVSPLWSTSVEPGHRVAAPPVGLNNHTKHTRGTSNATALASRGAAIAHEVIEVIRENDPDQLPATYDAVLLKALMAHGAQWGDLFEQIIATRPDITDRDAQRKFVGRWLGYGPVDLQRALICTQQRATLIGVGELNDGKAYSFSAPLPPSLATKVLWKRVTITLAWLTPVNPAHQAYRRAKLWVTPPAALDVSRQEGEWRQVQRGTLQHEILEGNSALAFVDGDRFVCKVNCKAEAGDLRESIPFAICVSLEVAEGINVPIYQEIKERIAQKVSVQN
ncbi:S8 family peptidase [Undibacterium sp. RuTC16W]|uniref:S8 family peptidase n=1 Tax=Undibacterium sp. RuTC16W TaxID=3413048 RepID=UPI003BF3270D